MRRVGSDFGSNNFELPDLDLDLPPYVPAKRPPSTPTEFVQHALDLAERHDANNPGGQARFLESTGTMHLEHGRVETAVLAYNTAERLFRRAMGPQGDPIPLMLFFGRAAKNLRQYGQSGAAAEFQRKHDAVLNGR